MHATVLMTVLLSTGCATRGELPIHLAAAAPDPTFEAVPQFVELYHEEEGWLRVPVDTGEPKMMNLEAGLSVDVALAELPKGTYTSVRIGTVVVAPDDTERTTSTADGQTGPTKSGPGLLHASTEIEAEFCVDEKREGMLELSIEQSSALEVPTYRVVNRPPCRRS